MIGGGGIFFEMIGKVWEDRRRVWGRVLKILGCGKRESWDGGG